MGNCAGSFEKGAIGVRGSSGGLIGIPILEIIEASSWMSLNWH